MSALFFEAQLSGVQWFRGIVHVGANVGQEVGFYAQLKDVPVLLVEPQPGVLPQLTAEVAKHPGGRFRIAEVAAGEVDDALVDFHVTREPNAQAASLLAPGAVVGLYPYLAETDVIQVRGMTLDTLLAREHPDLPVNMLAVDAQGADLGVLRGARATLARCDGVYVEVADQPLYQGGCRFKDIVDFLDDRGFGLYRAALTPAGWGNAFFKARVSPQAAEVAAIAARNVALRKPTRESSAFRGKLTAKSAVNGLYGQPMGYRSQRTRADEWIEIDLGAPHQVDEVILVGPATRGRSATIRVLGRADGAWTPIYDYAAEGKILSRFDRLAVGRCCDAVRVESRADLLCLAQVLVIGAPA